MTVVAWLVEAFAPQRARPPKRKPVEWQRYAKQVRRAERRLARRRHPLALTVIGTVVLAVMGSMYAQAIGVGVGKGLQDLGQSLVSALPQDQDEDLVLGETPVTVSAAPILDSLPEFLKVNEMLFEGRVQTFVLKPNSAISLKVNGKLYTTLFIGPDGRFGGETLALQDGTNVIEATLIEGTNVIAATSHTVVVDRTAPELTIVRPAKGDTIEGDEVIVEGMTEAGADVTVNDRALRPNPDGSFTERVLAAPGTLALVIVAKDKAGNETKTELSVNVAERTAPTAGLSLAISLDRALVKPGETIVAEIYALQDGQLLADLPVTLQVGVVIVGTSRTDANGVVRIGFAAPRYEAEDIAVVVLGGGATARASFSVKR